MLYTIWPVGPVLYTIRPVGPVLLLPARARLAALSPEGSSAALGAGSRVAAWWGWCGMVVVGTPGYAPWAYPGVHHPHPATPPPPRGYPRHRTQRRGTGLWAQPARRVRVSRGEHPALPGAFLYLRPFSSGSQKPPKRVLTNDWIGSRSRGPRALRMYRTWWDCR